MLKNVQKSNVREFSCLSDMFLMCKLAMLPTFLCRSMLSIISQVLLILCFGCQKIYLYKYLPIFIVSAIYTSVPNSSDICMYRSLDGAT